MKFSYDRSTGWRQFATRREVVSWVRLRRFMDTLPGGAIVDLACDRMNESALILQYAGHRFGIDLGEDAFRFSVEDPGCPDEVLQAFMGHVDELLRS